jgi:rSAM/selenodomain-associated transferase 2
MPAGVAVVIPTLDEAAQIVTCLEWLARLGAAEVVVADGGSRDGTPSLAAATGLCRVIETARNRGLQQNAGARATTAELLLFLHADCRPAPGAIEAIRATAFRAPRAPGGCLRMRVDDPDPRYRWIDAAADVRAAVLNLPYGDQAIWVRRRAWEAVGGFPEVPLMDDLCFALRLRRLGRLIVAPAEVRVSPRRWKARGLARQTLRNWTLTALAALGAPPAALARLYPPVRDVPLAAGPPEGI